MTTDALPTDWLDVTEHTTVDLNIVTDWQLSISFPGGVSIVSKSLKLRLLHLPMTDLPRINQAALTFLSTRLTPAQDQLELHPKAMLKFDPVNGINMAISVDQFAVASSFVQSAWDGATYLYAKK